MTVYKAAMSGIPEILQEEATTGNGRAIAIPSSFTRHAFYIRGIDTPSAGAVRIETADSPADSVWAPMTTNPTTVPDGLEVIEFEGVYGAFRCRVTTTVTSGSVTVEYLGGH